MFLIAVPGYVGNTVTTIYSGTTDRNSPDCHPRGNIYRGPYPSVCMPNCGHCNAFVTEQYIRVFAPGGMDTVRVCPDCEDVIRDGSDVRKTR